MKTITMYELLGMVKDGKAPKKIKYKETLYEYESSIKFYYNGGLSLYREFYQNGNHLNDEVEILEEEKKIPEKLDGFDLTTYSRDDEDLGLKLNYTGVSNTFNDVYFKINEIIDYLKSKGDE